MADRTERRSRWWLVADVLVGLFFFVFIISGFTVVFGGGCR